MCIRDRCQTIKDKGDMAPIVVGGQDIWHMGFLFHKAYNDQVLSKDPDFIEHCYEGTKDFSDETMNCLLYTSIPENGIIPVDFRQPTQPAWEDSCGACIIAGGLLEVCLLYTSCSGI